MRYVLTFASVHFVIKAARLLKGDGLDVLIIPIPRKISSECGMALEVQSNNIEKIKKLLETQDYRMMGVYEI